ncbi:MAG: hypothetical protein HN389_10470 [Clostridia bacterium]|nr:hypothetical protein [Clostridia bacterium]
MVLEKVKLTLGREDIRNENYIPAKEKCEGRVDLPVEDLILGILHRMITEDRG